MGKVHDAIDDRLRAFIETQQIFFVATSPSGASGHINISPKGLDSLRVLGPCAIAYLDHVGSGAETIAHLRENGRIVLMWCGFQGPPKILRVHGHGEVVEPQDVGFAELRGLFRPEPSGRAVIRIAVNRVSDSCGFGVPIFDYRGQRTQLPDWADRKGHDGLVEYQRDNNRVSIDALPALRWVATRFAGGDRR